jgi:hypothetical protein
VLQKFIYFAPAARFLYESDGYERWRAWDPTTERSGTSTFTNCSVSPTERIPISSLPTASTTFTTGTAPGGITAPRTTRYSTSTGHEQHHRTHRSAGCQRTVRADEGSR